MIGGYEICSLSNPLLIVRYPMTPRVHIMPRFSIIIVFQ